MADETLVPRPSPLLGLTEPMRAAADFASLLPGRFWLAGAPRGDGHRVLVLPGFTASDRSTFALRGFLRRQGFDARGWELGRNLGSPELSAALDTLLARALDETGAAVSLVGWSLGGVLARNLARREPGKIRSLITLGSPIAGSPTRTRAWRLYRQVHPSATSETSRPFEAGVGHAPPEGVASTAIWSRSDGIVPWQISREQPGPRRENLEVLSSHLGLGVNAAVLYAVADRLSQSPEAWQPFQPPWWLRPVLRRAS
jgi:pimeloyl-ACP methyl ester carboxylesterase